MQILEAKKIPLAVIVEALGGRYSHTDRKGDEWYFSPFRPDERTASFKISTKLNTWHDFGLASTFAHKHQGSGGDVLDLWNDYHQRDRKKGLTETLQGLRQFANPIYKEERLQREPRKEKSIIVDEQPRYKILKISERFTHFGLLNEIERRRLPRKLVSLYMKQGQIEDTVTGKIYYGFLSENDKGGYEVSIPNSHKGECFKTCIGPKASTRIMAGDDCNSADIFEGRWDMLTWLHMKGLLRPINHTYISNSTSLTSEVCYKIIAFKETIKYVFLFMDNDNAGYQATDTTIAELEPNEIKVASMAYLYNGYKDLSDLRMNKPLPTR